MITVKELNQRLQLARKATEIKTAKQIDEKFKRTDFYNKISTRQQEQYNKIMAEFLQERKRKCH